MINRYETLEMSKIWSDENKFSTWFKVEIVWLKHYLKFNNQEDNNLINRLEQKHQSINWTEFKKLVQEKESTTKHDVAAFLATLEHYVGDDAQKIHIALTSSDIVDTSFALLIQQSSNQLIYALNNLINNLFLTAKKYRGVVCLGRTHGQSAEAITFGIKLLSHIHELNRCLKRLKIAHGDISVGKFSGAVGVYSLADPQIEEKALSELGLRAEDCATQIVARDRHSFYITNLALLGSSIEHLANELRLLMHGQVQEAYENFSPGQVGSSAMPHKKNPVLCENVVGLMRLVRSYVTPILENQILWHERDISHSSVERVIFPDVFHLLDFAFNRMSFIIETMHVNQEKMIENLNNQMDLLCSQKVLLALLNKGLLRSVAYELVQKSSLSGDNFREELIKNSIYKYLSVEELDKVFSPNLVKQEDYLFKKIKIMN
jgi:adenylosuccinate lyase